MNFDCKLGSKRLNSQFNGFYGLKGRNEKEFNANFALPPSHHVVSRY